MSQLINQQYKQGQDKQQKQATRKNRSQKTNKICHKAI